MSLQPMKRLDIVIDSLHLTKTIDTLRKAGVSAYTVLPNAMGDGDRGEQLGDEVSGSSTNACIIVVVPAESVAAITAAVKPRLERSGGICLVSDCEWLDH